MSIPGFFQELSRYLKVSATVTGVVGSTINVGEDFTLTLSGANVSPIPQVVFRDARIVVSSTKYARPLEGTTVNIALADTLLRPGEASTVDIKMKAVSEIAGFWADLFNAEEIAYVRIYATLDPEHFFRVWNSATATHEIDPAVGVRSGTDG